MQWGSDGTNRNSSMSDPAFWTIADRLLDNEEGRSAFVYRCTEGKLTVGRGINIEALSDKMLGLIVLTKESQSRLNRMALLSAINDAQTYAGNDTWDLLSDNRKAVLISMAYQLGGAGLLKFVNARASLRSGDYAEFIAHSYDSEVATNQTPERWERQLKMFGEG